MKLYNPFKPHIVLFDNYHYAVRKLTSLGWAYLDNNKFDPCDDYWWHGVTLRSGTYYSFGTYKEADDRLRKYTRKFHKIIKVYT